MTEGQHNKRPQPGWRVMSHNGLLYPWHGQIRHQLLKGPRLLSLLLVVQCDLLAELPGVGATGARGARHGAGLVFGRFQARGEGDFWGRGGERNHLRRCNLSWLLLCGVPRRSHAGCCLEGQSTHLERREQKVSPPSGVNLPRAQWAANLS